ncbi:FmdB family zinc ribbon protein [Spiribacter halobius]|uniref:Zinc ribbon domain-containing protein n=1 Tax=Sediminicurvatus halobius TaxID=2182432 RepID=A0A2U2MW67_9GAMM|nr:zinc ribbon domain-containing protein [Spiribacter halobius]PWG61084.1 zinc ribbon domain-containing protein [Spiribacter halobius]UEX77110.1 zinc ribbon domain-containing protein [Spiribacter halobius]
MPIYEYVCDDCGHELEALQGMNDPELTDCPECQTASLRRRISAAAFRLKGGGWYETDFKSGNRRNIAGEGEKAAGKESKGEAKAEAKPESKSKSGDSGKSGGEKKAAAS